MNNLQLNDNKNNTNNLILNDMFTITSDNTNVDILNEDDWSELVEQSLPSVGHSLSFDISSDSSSINLLNENNISSDIITSRETMNILQMQNKLHLKNEYINKVSEHIDIETIKLRDITTLADIILLEDASMIAKNLKFQLNKRYAEDAKTTIIWMVISLTWLYDVMIELSKRNNQQLIYPEITHIDTEKLLHELQLIYLKNEHHNIEKQDDTVSSLKTNGTNRDVEIFTSQNNLSIDRMLECKHNKTEDKLWKRTFFFNKGDQKRKYNIKKYCSISRNSYKFCEFGCTCMFNYDKNEICYAQHYVFNLVAQDIIEVLYYMSIYHIKNDEMNEIKTSINTITYVINHMHEELSQLKVTNQKNYENYEKRIYKYRSNGKKKKLFK